MSESTSFAEHVKALGPRPMPKPGVYSAEAEAWHRRYLALFPTCPTDMLIKREARPFVRREMS